MPNVIDRRFQGVLPPGCLSLMLILFIQLDASKPCPHLCRCDNLGGLEKVENYVRCRGFIQNLNTLDGYPEHVVYFDVAGTSLNRVPDHYFAVQRLEEIVELDLSRNNLTFIHSRMFLGLNKLKVLNLGYNKIMDSYHFSPYSFSFNGQLTHLVLRGNQLGLVLTPLVDSQSLEILDVSDCGIPAMSHDAFSQVPSLQILNVAENPLSIIDPATVENLKYLKKLNISRTNIECDQNLAPLYDWGKESSVEITGYPCLNSHSLDGHSFRFFHRPSLRHDDPEWATPDEEVTTENDLMDHEENDPYEYINPSTHPEMSYDDFSADYPPGSAIPTDFTDNTSPKIHWTIWLSCAGGFALGVGLTIGLGFLFYTCCCKQPEDPNELVSAGEDFQLVPHPVDHVPRPTAPPDEPPSYSSLFSSRYHKVLPTAPVFTKYARR